MKRSVNLPAPVRPETPQAPAQAPSAGRTAPQPLKLVQDWRFAKAAKAYGDTQALTQGAPRALDIYL